MKIILPITILLVACSAMGQGSGAAVRQLDGVSTNLIGRGITTISNLSGLVVRYSPSISAAQYFVPSANTDVARGAALIQSQSTANAGDEISVLAGTYNIGTNSINIAVCSNWFFFPGAIVTASNTCILDGGGAAIGQIRGAGQFRGNAINAYNGIGWTVILTNAGSALYLECFSLTNLGVWQNGQVMSGCIRMQAAASINAKVYDSIGTATYDAVWGEDTASSIILDADSVMSGDQSAFEIYGACKIKARLAYGGTVRTPTAPTVYAFQAANQYFEFDTVIKATNQSYALEFEGGDGDRTAYVTASDVQGPMILRDLSIVELNQSTLTATNWGGAFTNVGCIFMFGTAKLTTRSISLIEPFNSNFSISGDSGASLVVNGLSINKPVESDITISGINIFGSTSTLDSYASRFFNTSRSNRLAAASISVGASPFNWTNTTGGKVTVYTSTLTGSIALNGTTITGTISGIDAPPIGLQTNEWLTVTYTIAPSMFWKPE